MSPVIRWLTVFLMLIPAGLLLAPPPLRWVGLAVAILYAVVWLFWRPSAFVVGPEDLLVKFPLRTRGTPLAGITGVCVLKSDQLKTLLGAALRVGVGGLWGGFGWLRTARKRWVEFYISRTDDFVWIERGDKIPLLISPADPEGFCAALTAKGIARATP